MDLGTIHLYPDDWKQLPIPDVPPEKQAPTVALVEQILAAKNVGANSVRPPATMVTIATRAHAMRPYKPLPTYPPSKPKSTASSMPSTA